MQRILRLILSMVFTCVILVGCGGTGNHSGDSASSDGQKQTEKKEYVPGERTETEYSSEWIGLRYTLNSDMVMATDEELNDMMELGAEALSDKDGKNLLAEYAKLTTVYEMMAVNVADQSNIIICAEKLTLSATTEEQYLAAVKKQMEDVYADFTVTYADVTSRELGGMTFSELGYVVDYGGTPLYQTYLVKKMDNRMYGIVLSYSEESVLDTLLAGFSAM